VYSSAWATETTTCSFYTDLRSADHRPIHEIHTAAAGTDAAYCQFKRFAGLDL